MKMHPDQPGMREDALIPRTRTTIVPGAVHVPDWLDPDRQAQLVEACRSYAVGPVPMRHTAMPNGGRMSVSTVCLGWHWMPYRYSKTADNASGGTVAELPEWMAQLGREAVAAAYQDTAYQDGQGGDLYTPDAALINFYGDDARMGMHQDKDEKTSDPVVSLSLGDSCLFRFGNTENRNRPYTDLRLESGDLFVFGGPARFAYHGVVRTYPGTAGPGCGLASGRLNITMRVTGL